LTLSGAPFHKIDLIHPPPRFRTLAFNVVAQPGHTTYRICDDFRNESGLGQSPARLAF